MKKKKEKKEKIVRKRTNKNNCRVDCLKKLFM